jgi:putative membrane protein
MVDSGLTLVLSVDRDDDFGRKAAVKSPMVGRDANLRGAVALALADPEDSDANAVFAAIRTTDKLREGGHAAEVATICGSASVGVESDRTLARQLEQVLEQVRPASLILVTNGAEDEQFIPMIQSRIRIDAVERVVVKKAPRLEALYYLTRRLLEDEKVQQKFILPLSLALVIWGLSIVTHHTELAWGATFLVVGLWMLIHILGWDKPLGLIAQGFGRTITGGPLSLAVFMLSLLVAGYGSLLATRATPVAWGAGSRTLYVAGFIAEWIPWALAGLVVLAVGRTLDDLVHKRAQPPERWPLLMGGLAFGFLLQALGAGFAAYLRGVDPLDLLRAPGVYGPLLAGVTVAVVGTLAVRRRRATVGAAR